jgi:hypothetical protein
VLFALASPVRVIALEVVLELTMSTESAASPEWPSMMPREVEIEAPAILPSMASVPRPELNSPEFILMPVRQTLPEELWPRIAKLLALEFPAPAVLIITDAPEFPVV